MINHAQEAIRELRDEALAALRKYDVGTAKEKLITMDQYFDVVPSPLAPIAPLPE